MSSAQDFIADLKRGIIIGTDNETCKRYGTNDMRDLARKAKGMGYNPKRTYERVIVRGHSTRVVKYSAPTEH